MPYEKEHITKLAHLKELAQITKTKIDGLSELELALRTQIQALEARYDANVTASTDSDADYAAEVADGRVDAWGNAQGSLGTNIRGGQSRLNETIETLQKDLQAQLDTLSAIRLKGLLDEIGAHSRRKKELACEEYERIESDNSLQAQVQSLSEASLRIMLMLSDIREVLRKTQKEM